MCRMYSADTTIVMERIHWMKLWGILKYNQLPLAALMTERSVVRRAVDTQIDKMLTCTLFCVTMV